MPALEETDTARLGVDLGSVNLHAVALDRSGAERCWVAPLEGRPLERLFELVREEIAPFVGDSPLRLGVTGQGRALLEREIECAAVNELAASALGARLACGGFANPRTVIDLGGQLSKWMLLDDDGSILDFSTNGLCAAGAGSFLAQQASRLGIGISELGRTAAAAERSAKVAGRCSVFAKSDMIHLQQKGTPLDEIALGVCRALADNFVSTVLAGRTIEPPLALVGGGAATPGLVRALIDTGEVSREHLVEIPAPLCAGARGAAELARDAPAIDIAKLAAIDAAASRARRRQRAATLPPLPDVPEHREPRPAPISETGPVEAFLGVDVGSVSTNLVLLSPRNEVLQAIYLRTRGRPLEVLAAGLERIRAKLGERLRVLGCGATGSGRHLAGELLGADVVRNEITAQLASAAHYFDQVDAVFEIGGQDSKFIGTRDGHLSGFEMNKICAAGTGSFLEEQAEMLGVSIVDEFAALALRADRARDLGTRCTVFMEAELRNALQEGTAVPRLCAGLAYSVARNYLERVVAGRPVGEHVVFQGGTASNRAVVAALAGVLGRGIRVHPWNRVSGAIGMALIAAHEKAAGGYRPAFRGLDSCSGAESSSFECRGCENRCLVSRIRAGGRTLCFGDICEKHSGRDALRRRRERPFPELFAERERLFSSAVERAARGEGKAPGGTLGIARASLGLELSPLLAAAARGMGFEPRLSEPTSERALELGSRGLPAEICLPIKAAAGHYRLLSEAGGRVLCPSIVDLRGAERDEETFVCHLTQELPFILPPDLAERLDRPQFGLGRGAGALLETARSLAETLDVPVRRAARALWRGLRLQRGFEAELRRLGRRALESSFDRAVVVIGRPYNLHDPLVNLELARHLNDLGLPAIPVEMLPLDDEPLERRWSSIPWIFARRALKAVELIRRDTRLFPVAVSSFGCGVDGFLGKHLEELLADRPHLLLEFDEHRAAAGLITRLEAFADEIEDHLRGGSRGAPARSTPASDERPRGGRVLIPHLEEFSHVYSGSLRAAGYRTELLPRPTASTIALGEAHSSGRECHPYAVIGGQLAELWERDDVGEDDVFLSPASEVACLLRQYGDGYRIAQRRAGARAPQVFDVISGEIHHLIGLAGALHFYEGLAVAELLIALARRVRPYSADGDEPLETCARAMQEVEEALADSRPLGPISEAASREMLGLAQKGRPGDRPVVGITGDLYTRFHQAGNHGLFDRLEEMGLEVWLSPFFATSSQFAELVDRRRLLGRAELRRTALSAITSTSVDLLYRAMVGRLPAEARPLVVEPPAEKLYAKAVRHAGPRSSWLHLLAVGKLIDFLDRGAAGALSVAGVNCMVGTAIAGAIPSIRREAEGAPVMALSYGGTEGPAQRIGLETFAQQVLHRAAAAGGGER